MTEQEIRKLQKIEGLDTLQEMIDSGIAWKMEGSVGRSAHSALQNGACFLPEIRHTNACGTVLNKRSDREKGDSGTLEYSSNYWKNEVEAASTRFHDSIDFLSEQSRPELEALLKDAALIQEDATPIREEIEIREALIERAKMEASLVLEESGVAYTIEEVEGGIQINTDNPGLMLRKIAERLKGKATHSKNPLCAPMGEDYE